MDIKNLVIFSDFNPDEIAFIEKHFKMKSFEGGETIIDRDENKKELFIVLQGKIIRSQGVSGSIERNQGEFQRGDFFGGISLFGNKPALGRYFALEKSILLSIKEKNINSLIENNSEIAVKLISHLLSLTIQQLRKSSRFFADVVQWGENASRRVITDEMTGIYNRAFLEDALENFFSISKSNNKPLTLFMLDIDNFRKINEVLGLETGNRILQELVDLIQKVTSKHGIIARYGGDEFSILLPEADLKRAKIMAEQIRSDVEKFDFSKYLAGKNIPVSLSIGISSFPDTADDLETFKKKADEALYKAKELGRNRVEWID